MNSGVQINVKLQQPFKDMDRVKDGVVYVYIFKIADEAIYEFTKMYSFTINCIKEFHLLLYVLCELLFDGALCWTFIALQILIIKSQLWCRPVQV